LRKLAVIGNVRRRSSRRPAHQAAAGPRSHLRRRTTSVRALTAPIVNEAGLPRGEGLDQLHASQPELALRYQALQSTQV
jgi:hypothetical protein